MPFKTFRPLDAKAQICVHLWHFCVPIIIHVNSRQLVLKKRTHQHFPYFSAIAILICNDEDPKGW
jgi:hypothetical protein